MTNSFKFTDYINYNNKTSGVLETFCTAEDYENIKIILSLLNEDKTYHDLYHIYNVNLSKVNTVVSGVVKFIDDKINIQNLNQMISLAVFIGANLESIINSFSEYIRSEYPDVHEKMKNEYMETEMKDNPAIKFESIIKELEKTFRQIVESGEKYEVYDDFEYNYEIITNNGKTLHLTNKGEGKRDIENEDFVNAINEIISKEGFEKIKELSVFYTDLNSDVFEIKVNYSNEHCKKVRLEKI